MIGPHLGVTVLAPRGAGVVPPVLLDFVQGRYVRGAQSVTTFTSLTGVSFGRSGAGTAQRADGSLAFFASDAPRITDRGLWVEAAATNRCAVFNANPDAALTGLTRAGAASAGLTRVAGVATLAAAGLAQVATSGFLFRLDNSAGATAATVTAAGATGSTAAHSFSAWVAGGSGWVGRNTSSNQTFTAGALRRVVAAGLSVSSSSAWALQADAGQVVDFILPQMEAAGLAGSPIVTTGAAETRGADGGSIIVPAGCTTWTAAYGEGLTASGSVTPGAAFDLVAGRPWLGGFLKTLVMN